MATEVKTCVDDKDTLMSRFFEATEGNRESQQTAW